jgi:CDI immunity proteins
MKSGFDRSRSLEQLEGVDWGEPNYDSSLVTTCHELRRKPLNRFTEEDLRIMIGQKISLPYLIPLAIERLEEDPLVEGCFFRGDLLAVVLRVGEPFWSDHPEMFERVCQRIQGVKIILPSLDEIDTEMVSKVLAEASDAFGQVIDLDREP